MVKLVEHIIVKTYPEEEFDTEEEAISYAFKLDKWATWLIVPIVKFDNF